MKICKSCLMLDTRPRLSFNKNGVCAACEWAEMKKEINWNARKEQLREFCDSIRGKQRYDCIVPASGGKDSIYVADKMKNEFNLNILTVTITPPLETDLIQENMKRFLSYGFDNFKITPNPKIMQSINKFGFINRGFPSLGWISCLNSVTFRLAADMKVPLIVFGEEGETEYGGTTKFREAPYYDIDTAIDIYTEGNNPKQYLSEFDEKDVSMWMYPSVDEMRKADFKVTHWSYFDNWDPYVNYIYAKEHYGMQVPEHRNLGTYTNYAQLDTPLYSLHTYLMYLKFGFGRCLQDACIDIRFGRLTREQALELIKKYDGEYIEEYIPLYLDYYQMTREEFNAVLDKHANKDLFEKKGGIWKPKFRIA